MDSWEAFCPEHRQKTDDLCPRCTIELLRHERDIIHAANDAIQSWMNEHGQGLPGELELLLSTLDVVLNGP